MKSKVAMIVSLLAVLAVGGAALAVNTRILNTSPQPDIGRANEVLVPGGPQPATATPSVVPPTVMPSVVPTTAAPAAVSPRNDDEHSRNDDEHSRDGHTAPHEDEHERDD